MSHVERIDLEQARKRAKELLRRWRAEGREERLADAQRQVARGLGYSSWPTLVEAVTAERATEAERAELFVLQATGGPLRRAEALLEAYPAVADGRFGALVLGDARRVEAELARDPAFATRAGGPRAWLPLQYVAHSRFLGRERTPGLVETARILLDGGADPSAGDPTPLYGAAGVAHEPLLTRLLLEAGANPDDGESLYHATEARDNNDCLRILLEHGAQVSTGVLMHKLDYVDDVEGVRLLLERIDVTGAPSGRHHGQLWVGATPLHQAVLRRRSPEIVRLLVDHGAPLEARDGAGRTPYGLAVAIAADEQAAVLAGLGARAETDPLDELVGACIRADEAAARRLLGEHPDLPARRRPVDHEALATAVREHRIEAARLMLDLGFDPNVPGELAATPLHFAAADGRTDLVELLLRHGAAVDAVAVHIDANSTPLAWTVYASANEAGDYAGVVDLLVAAGARVEPWMADEADEEVADRLRKRAPGESGSDVAS